MNAVAFPLSLDELSPRSRHQHVGSLLPFRIGSHQTSVSPSAGDAGSDSVATISSGVAAGITIAVFFVVFIFTFGCRIYSEYVDRGSVSGSSSASLAGEPTLTESVAADFWICGVPREPPPPYDLAIMLPTVHHSLSVRSSASSCSDSSGGPLAGACPVYVCPGTPPPPFSASTRSLPATR